MNFTRPTPKPAEPPSTRDPKKLRPRRAPQRPACSAALGILDMGKEAKKHVGGCWYQNPSWLLMDWIFKCFPLNPQKVNFLQGFQQQPNLGFLPNGDGKDPSPHFGQFGVTGQQVLQLAWLRVALRPGTGHGGGWAGGQKRIPEKGSLECGASICSRCLLFSPCWF